MRNTNIRKLLAVMIVLVLVLQFMPLELVSALDGTAQDLTGTPYVIVHGTTDTPPSVLELYQPDGTTPITPDANGEYHDVPANAVIQLDYVFELADGIEPDIYNYMTGDYFTETLPTAINFKDTSGILTAHDETPDVPDYNLADWAVAGNHLTVTLTEAATSGADEDIHLARWGLIRLKGTFSALNTGDPTVQQITLGDQTITINRLPLPTKSTLAKSWTYDASTNRITWKVTVTRPNDSIDYAGYTLTDVFSANQTYVDGSFTVASGSTYDAAGLTATGNKLDYIFPTGSPIKATQVITYQTTPNDFSAETGTTVASTYSNTASLDSPAGIAADPVTSNASLGWISKSGTKKASATDDTITQWTVTVTVPGIPVPGTPVPAISGAQIVDTLGAGLEYLISPPDYPIKLNVGGTEYTVAAEDYTLSGSTLTYSFPSDKQPKAGTSYSLIYYTRVTDRTSYLNSNAAVTFSNSANLAWNENVSGTQPGASASLPGIGAGGLVMKSADADEDFIYDSVNPEIITWTITVNRNKISIPNAKITDTVPANQELVIDADHPFTVTKVGGSDIDTFTTTAPPSTVGVFTYTSANKFEYKFPEETAGSGTINSTYTVSFSTKIKDYSPLYKNATVKNYTNFVELSGTGVSASSTGTKNYRSQMIEKTIATAYNYDTHAIQWQIVVNRNRLPMVGTTLGAIISDTLPAGMTLLIDDTHPFDVAATNSGTLGTLTGVTGDSSFTYALPLSTSEQYTLKFWTKVTDETLSSQWYNKSFSNQSTLAVPGKSSLNSAISVSLNNPVITKATNYVSSSLSDTVNWTVYINPGQVLLNNGLVTDELNTNLSLDASSLKLYTATVASSNGALTIDQEVAKEDTASAAKFAVTLPTSANGNKLLVHLPTGTSRAYILSFSTNILHDSISFTNAVSLTDSTGSTNGNASSNQVVVSDIYAQGGSGSNALTVHKVNMTGDALKGVQFRLLNVNKQPIKRSGSEIVMTTDDSGKVVFDKLPSWVFYVEEIKPLDGYLITNRYSYGTRLTGTDTLTVKDALALTDVSFTKTGANGAALTGGTFTLTGKDYADNDVTRTATADQFGVVKFKDVPLGKTGAPYTITETAAPIGHTASTTTLSATVVYNDDYSSLNVTVTPDTLFNKPHTTEVSFTKTGLGGAALAGGSFTLTGTDYESTPVSKTVAAGADGTVTFSGIPIGSYTVYEETPPTGYLRPASEAILDVTVAYTTNKDALAVAITGKDDNAASYDAAKNSFKNSLGTASVGIDKVGTGVSLSGGKFTLTGTAAHNGQTFTIADIAADASGKVSFSNVPIGSYTIRETAAPTGHQLNDAPIYVTVGYNTDKTAVVVKYGTAEDSINQDSASLINTPIPATVSFTKTDLEGKPISGGSFSLYQGTTQIGSAVTAGADGTVTFSDIPIGSYTVYEDDSPSGYLMPGTTSHSPAPAPVSKQILHVAVAYNEAHTGLVVTITDPMVDSGMTPVVSYANDPALGELHFKKVDAQNHSKLLSGGQFELTGKDYADRTVKMTASADKDGIVSFTDIPLVKEGTVYTVTEVTPPIGYRLTNDPMHAVVAYTSDKTGVQSYWLGKDGPLEGDPFFENLVLPPTGYIEIVKTDDSGTRLPGAEFTLYNSTGQALKTAVSDENGIAKFSEVAINQTYTIRETKTPEGYESSKDVISLMLTDNQTRTFTVVNKKLVEKSGSISILKTDETGAPLSGAEFTLYDKDGKALETVVTQADGTAKFSNLPAGSYTVSETRAPLGYTLLAGKTPVTLSNKQNVSLSFVNKKDLKATGVLQLLKVDKDYHPLSGAEFTLYDKDGNELAKSVSGSDGLVLFSDLASGSYTVKETTAPSGYKLFSEPLTVEISTSDPVLSYTLKDLLLTDDTGVEGWNDNNNGGTLPKTGGIPWTFYLLLAGLGSLLTGLGLMRPERKRGKHSPKSR